MSAIVKNIKGVFILSRPVNVIIGMLSIFVAAFITRNLHPLQNVFLACLAGGLVAAAANTINDYFDIRIDSINKPYRPIPSGMISPQAALIAATLEFLMAVVTAFLISLAALVIVLVFSLLLFFYSFRLKRIPIWGNLAVSLSTAAAFVFGGVAVYRIERTLIPAAFAFFYHFGREIIKDVQDMSGDSRDNAHTFPLVYGIRPAINLTIINYLLLSILTILPFWFNVYSMRYFTVVVLGIYPVLAYTIYSIRKETTFKKLGFVSNLLKADMVIGLLAIYLG